MEYIKLKISYAYNPTRLNRTIAIREDVDLCTLGAIIGESIHAKFEHIYLFSKNNKNFVIDEWLDDYNESYLPMKNHYLSDLGDSFKYEYDTGEGYVFHCKILKTKYKYIKDEYDVEYPLAFVINGVGQGIFENARYSLDAYLDGEIDPETDTEDLDNGVILPYNLDMEKFADFDKPLDLEILTWCDEEIEYFARHYRNGNSDSQDFENDVLTLEDEDFNDDLKDIEFDTVDLFSLISFAKIEEKTKFGKKVLKQFKNIDEYLLPDIIANSAIEVALTMLANEDQYYLDKIIKKIEEINNK